MTALAQIDKKACKNCRFFYMPKDNVDTIGFKQGICTLEDENHIIVDENDLCIFFEYVECEVANGR